MSADPLNPPQEPAASGAPNVRRLHVIVQGRVQGVGFRWWTADEARELGLRGTVRNLPDGGVEVEAEGPAPALEEFLRRLKRGPILARVRETVERWSDGPARFSEFRITI